MSEYNGLNPKFWKEIKKDLKDLGLPEPANKYGFTDKQLHESLSSTEYNKFWRWMYGQTMMKSDDGVIVYVDDVIRGIKLIRYSTPTYFD